MPPVTLTVLLKVPAEGVATFQAYEDRVLPLVAVHGGTLERRLRNADGTVECHILRFPSREAFASFRADPRRLDAAPMLTASAAVAEVYEMTDVAGGT